MTKCAGGYGAGVADSLVRWWRSRRAEPRRGRTSGEPASSNGASSFHLRAGFPATESLVAVEATIEVLEPPTVPRLYFWALQATFADTEGASRGGAHLGLQSHPANPGGCAANWGGYADRRDGGGLLRGSLLRLSSATGNANTGDFPWEPHRPYVLRIGRDADPRAAGAPPGATAWRGEIVDTATGATTLVRHLFSAGDHLNDVMVWSEVFARCDHPSVIVRWSGIAGRTAGGDLVRADRVRASYQAEHDGGCANTTIEVDEVGVCQVTNRPRTVTHGSVLRLPLP